MIVKAREVGTNQLVEFAVAVLLTTIAGFVDAVGFLSFARIYTANMSGNSVAVGIALSQPRWSTLLFRSWPILFYICGLIFGRSLIEMGVRQRLRRIASIAFGCEVVLLAIVGVAHRWQYLSIALLAAAMGIQNAALTRFSSLTLHTGFVTGTLVKFSEQFVAYTASLLASLRKGNPFLQVLATSTKHKAFRLSLFLALTWVAYVIGAALGAWGKSVAQSQALRAPMTGLMLLMGVDLFKPLAIQEEQQQAQLREGR